MGQEDMAHRVIRVGYLADGARDKTFVDDVTANRMT
jgi:hypothetical protein